MAESIVRLRVESQEFESKLKRASQELLAMADNARRTGATFAIADKEELAFVSSLGQLQTSARSAKGSIAEMTKAFQDLSMHYRSLTDEEKAAPYGQELKKSLEQLQNRINDGKKALGEINGTIGESKNKTDILSGAVNDLAGKFGLSVPKLGAMSVAIAGVTGALKVAKDAFFASEANLDEWGRTVDASKAVYEGFLTSLNTGDISGFLQRIDQIISAAREAYDELDRLGTQRTIDSPRLNAQRAENERFRAMLRTGRYIAPTDGRKATMKEGQLLTKAQLDNISRMLENGMKNVNNITKSEIQQIRASINALYKKEAANLGMSLSEFKKGTSSMTALDERIEGYNKYEKTQREIDMAKRSVAIASAEGLTVDEKTYEKARQKNPYERYKAWGVFKDSGDTMTQITELVTQMTNLQTQVTNTTAQGYRNINRVEGITVGGGRSGGGGGRVGGTPVPDVVIDPLAGIKFQQTEFDGGVMNSEFGAMVTELAAKYFKQTFDESIRNMDSETVKSLMQTTETVNDVFKNVDMKKPEPVDRDRDKADDRKQGRQDNDISKLAKGVGALSNITSAIQGLGMELPEELTRTVAMIQALMSVIQGVQAIIQVFGSTTQTANTVALGLNTGALGALTATMSANTAANVIPFLAHGGIAGKVVNSKRFAYGGMVVNSQRFAYGGHVSGISKRAADGFVGGNNYSGDLIPIAVNSGELILNRAQQGNLASQLSGMGLGAIEVYGRISGEDINLSSRRRHNRMVRSETTR